MYRSLKRIKIHPNMKKFSCVLQELLSKKEFPADVEGSRRLIEEHTQLKKKVKKLPSGQSDTVKTSEEINI